MTYDLIMSLILGVIVVVLGWICWSYHLENQRLRKANLQASRNDHRDERGRYTGA